MYVRSNLGQTPGITSTDVLNFTSLLLPAVQSIGTTIYSAKAAKDLAKKEAKWAAQEEAARAAAQVIYQPGPSSGGLSTGALIGIVGGSVALLGVIILIVMQSSKGGGSAGSGGTSYSSPAPSAPDRPAEPAKRIKRIKRISRPKKKLA